MEYFELVQKLKENINSVFVGKEEVVEPVLLHRISLTSEAKIRKEDASKILRSLILKVKVSAVYTGIFGL